ncbi:MAG TPA: arginase family protein [Thermoanaerobaculia bacterium]|nr:arginase family protein [Thermoanaerobaculia bacterium]
MTRVFTLPYDCGQRNVRMGAGPVHLAQLLGLPAEEIQPASPFPQEVRTSFELYRALASRLAESDEFPVVLSGHCGASIGAAAGLGADAILWFDAHGDYNTPDTTDTGFLDGMCLAVATGRCWRGIARTIPGFTPIDPRRVIHVGARDWSPGEREALLHDGVRLSADFDGFAAQRLLVHVDLDVIDSRYGRANHFACEGGPSPDEVLAVIAAARERFPIVGLVLASYDPSCNPDGRIADAALRIIRSF